MTNTYKWSKNGVSCCAPSHAANQRRSTTTTCWSAQCAQETVRRRPAFDGAAPLRHGLLVAHLTHNCELTIATRTMFVPVITTPTVLPRILTDSLFVPPKALLAPYCGPYNRKSTHRTQHAAIIRSPSCLASLPARHPRRQYRQWEHIGASIPRRAQC